MPNKNAVVMLFKDKQKAEAMEMYYTDNQYTVKLIPSVDHLNFVDFDEKPKMEIDDAPFHILFAYT